MKGYWYCPVCKTEVDGINVTFSEHHDADCGAPVLWTKPDHIAAPLELVNAVAHVGIDFGYGPYQLETKFIEQAREIMQQQETEPEGNQTPI